MFFSLLTLAKDTTNALTLAVSDATINIVRIYISFPLEVWGGALIQLI